MAQRLKGQEVEISLIVDGAKQASLTDIRSFEVTPMFETKEEGYLGETSNRYDEFFKGVRGKMELNFEDDGVFDIFTAVLDRAQRRDPNVRINVKATFNFPNGDKPRVLMQDVFFGEMPFNFGSRADYGSLSLDFVGSTITVM